MASGLTVIVGSTPLQGATLTMIGATVLVMKADPVTCAKIGGAMRSGTYLNLPVSSIPVSSMQNVFIAS